MTMMKTNGKPRDMTDVKRRYDDLVRGNPCIKKQTSGNNSKQTNLQSQLSDAEKAALLEQMAIRTVCQLRHEFRKVVLR